MTIKRGSESVVHMSTALAFQFTSISFLCIPIHFYLLSPLVGLPSLRIRVSDDKMPKLLLDSESHLICIFHSIYLYMVSSHHISIFRPGLYPQSIQWSPIISTSNFQCRTFFVPIKFPCFKVTRCSKIKSP